MKECKLKFIIYRYFQNMSYEIMKKINPLFDYLINKPGKI